jgi:Fe2+ transport system protein FeoA
LPNPQDTVPFRFLQLKKFHTPPGKKRVGPLVAPEIDFHQMLTALLPYPRLLRELGLVHDLEVRVPLNLAPTGTVKVRLQRGRTRLRRHLEAAVVPRTQ